MPKKKQGVSIRPSDYRNTIESWLLKDKPPKANSDLMHKLDFHNTGISSVIEALKQEPLRTGYRELSRYASKVGLERMVENPSIVEVQSTMRKYLDVKKMHKQEIRTFWDEYIKGAVSGYHPYKEAGNVRVWMWDEESKDALYGLLSDCCLQRRMFFVFVADALSEIEELGEVANDLEAEYQRGIMSLGCLLNAVTYAYSECKKST